MFVFVSCVVLSKVFALPCLTLCPVFTLQCLSLCPMLFPPCCLVCSAGLIFLIILIGVFLLKNVIFSILIFSVTFATSCSHKLAFVYFNFIIYVHLVSICLILIMPPFMESGGTALSPGVGMSPRRIKNALTVSFERRVESLVNLKQQLTQYMTVCCKAN